MCFIEVTSFSDEGRHLIKIKDIVCVSEKEIHCLRKEDSKNQKIYICYITLSSGELIKVNENYGVITQKIYGALKNV